MRSTVRLSSTRNEITQIAWRNIMMGFESPYSACLIAQQRMQQIREEVQAIRDAEAAMGDKPNRIANGVKVVVQFVKRFYPERTPQAETIIEKAKVKTSAVIGFSRWM